MAHRAIILHIEKQTMYLLILLYYIVKSSRKSVTLKSRGHFKVLRFEFPRLFSSLPLFEALKRAG